MDKLIFILIFIAILNKLFNFIQSLKYSPYSSNLPDTNLSYSTTFSLIVILILINQYFFNRSEDKFYLNKPLETTRDFLITSMLLLSIFWWMNRLEYLLRKIYAYLRYNDEYNYIEIDREKELIFILIIMIIFLSDVIHTFPINYYKFYMH